MKPDNQRIEANITRLLDYIKAYTSEEQRDPFEVSVIYRTACDVISFYEQFWNFLPQSGFDRVISAPVDLAESLACTAVMLQHHKQFDAAADVLNVAIELNPGRIHYTTLLADILRRKGDCHAARQLCEQILHGYPTFPETQTIITHCDVFEQLGDFQEYYTLLNIAHTTLNPKVYIEIGVSNGKSLALARNNTVALGIDPITAIINEMVFLSPENIPKLFKLTSNDFFDLVDVRAEMGQPTFDMAFVDGLHLFEQVLRDFINLEKYAGPGSVIFIHDCLPANRQMTERVRQSAFWIGDVWKIIPCLKEIRPDLQIATFPAQPSGLAVIRKLDPHSHVLERHFDEIVSHYMEKQLPLEKQLRFELLNVVSAPEIDTFICFLM